MRHFTKSRCASETGKSHFSQHQHTTVFEHRTSNIVYHRSQYNTIDSHPSKCTHIFIMATTNKKKSIKMCDPALLQTATDPLVGLTIQSHYSIGSFLGAGAFGQVYTILDRRNPNQKSWAVKVVSVATTTAAVATTATKKKKTATTNADRLHYEYLMYTQQLSHLCGTILPKLPNPPLHQLKCFYSKIHNATNHSGTFFVHSHFRKRAGSV